MKTFIRESGTFLAFVILLPLLLELVACNQGPARPGDPGNSDPAVDYSQLEQVDSTDDYGYHHQFFRDEAGRRSGRYEKFTPSGKPVEEAFFLDDQLEGTRVIFYESGDTQLVESHHLGRFAGEYRYYYENGQLQLVGKYVDGEMSGEWRKYYETGGLMEIVTFQHNEENGPFTEYYPNGNLKAEGNYLQGDFEHGELKLYDEEGRLVRTMHCEKGICRTTWSAEEAKG